MKTAEIPHQNASLKYIERRGYNFILQTALWFWHSILIFILDSQIKSHLYCVKSLFRIVKLTLFMPYEQLSYVWIMCGKSNIL